MQALAYWKAVTADRSEFLERLVALLSDSGIRYCVLGLRLPVAPVDSVLQGKIWAAQDPGRRPSKRQKDLADIARILEAYPDLRRLVPEALLSRLV
jgi:hypothetical protein